MLTLDISLYKYILFCVVWAQADDRTLNFHVNR